MVQDGKNDDGNYVDYFYFDDNGVFHVYDLSKENDMLGEPKH